MQIEIKTPLAWLCLFLLFTACNKDKSAPEPEFTLTFGKIELPKFGTSDWEHVITKDIDVNISSPELSLNVNETVSMKSYESYAKVVKKGNYSITLASVNTTLPADTSLRFSADIKGKSIAGSEMITFQASSIADGLVTISKDAVADKTIPTFSIANDPKLYVLGFKNGYYFLYVKGGLTGTLNFTSKLSKQHVAKKIDVLAKEHYNVVTKISSNTLDVSFGPFVIVDVPAASTRLVTITPVPFSHNGNTKTIYLAADNDGNILDSHEYNGETEFTLKSDKASEYTHINIFVVNVLKVTNGIKELVRGYLHIKKGITWKNSVDSDVSPGPSYSKIDIKIKAGSYNNAIVSTDGRGNVYGNTTAVLDQFENFDTGKLFFQLITGTSAKYTFMDIPKGTTAMELDPARATSVSKTGVLTVPGQGAFLTITGYPGKSEALRYLLFANINQGIGNTLRYFYPDTAMDRYRSRIVFYSNDSKLMYVSNQISSTIPTSETPIDAKYTGSGTTLTTFIPSFSGKYDYASYVFGDGVMQLELYSAFSTGNTRFKLPDFNLLIGKQPLIPTNMKLQFLSIAQSAGFKETVPSSYGLTNNHAYKQVSYLF